MYNFSYIQISYKRRYVVISYVETASITSYESDAITIESDRRALNEREISSLKINNALFHDDEKLWTCILVAALALT